MSRAASTLRNYLAADERLTAVHSATLSDEASWIPVSLGVTDRRLLCVSEDGTFVNVGLDSVSAIRSRPRKASTYRGNDYRVLMAIGVLVAALCFVAVASLASSLLVPLLLPAFVGGLASAEYQRRAMGGIEWGAMAEGGALEDAGNRQVLLVGNGLVAVVSFVGIVVLAPGVLVPLLALATVGGVALVDYARRHKSEFDGIEIVRRREREVSISTDDGSTVHVRCDPSEELDRVLAREAFAERDEVVRTASPRS